MRARSVPAVFFMAMTLASCAGRNEASESAVAEAKRRIRFGADPFVTLSALDQEWPNDVRIKAELASMLLACGRYGEADGYLARAEVLVKGRKDRAAVRAARARLAVERGDFVAARRYAESAMADDPADPGGAEFPLARAVAAGGDRDGGRKRFAAALAAKAGKATREDWRFWIRFLAEDDAASALDALDSYEAAYPYEPGTGLVESALRERTGDLDGSVLAAFKDALYAFESGAVPVGELLSRLEGIETGLADASFNPDCRGLAAVRAAKAYLDGDWAVLGTALGTMPTASKTKSWLESAASLSPSDPGSIRGYAESEKRYGFFPSYRLRFALVFLKDAGRRQLVRSAGEAGIDGFRRSGRTAGGIGRGDQDAERTGGGGIPRGIGAGSGIPGAGHRDLRASGQRLHPVRGRTGEGFCGGNGIPRGLRAGTRRVLGPKGRTASVCAWTVTVRSASWRFPYWQ
ncbi:MAG: hypothetical protein NT080_05935 [Spirochaetes bacterium]|nr:hypothetical protein [Spirochaetota bacterium]